MSGLIKDPPKLDVKERENERSALRGTRATSLAQLLRPARAAAGEPNAIHEGRQASVDLGRDSQYRRLLATADVVSVAVTLTVATVLLGDDTLAPATLAIFPFVVLAGKVGGIYDRDELLIRKTTLEEAPSLFHVTSLTVLIFWLGEAAFVNGTLEKEQVVSAWGLLLATLLAARALARMIGTRTTPAERCLVIGDKAAGARIQRKLAFSHGVNAELVGRVPLRPDGRNGSAPQGPEVIGILADLDYVLRKHQIDRVIIALGSTDSDKLLPLIRLVKALGVKVSVLPRLFEVVGSSVEFDDIDGATLLGVRRYGLTKSSWYLKRSLDIVASAGGLILLAPLLTLCALAVKLDSRGPVFFRQARIGRHGDVFHMLKLRTMFDGADEQKAELLDLSERDGLFKLSRDPRVTRVGRFLRRASLDELPQLFNVLRGDMSLVGPRPLVAEEADRVPEALRRQEGTPGMTGPWQVCGSNDIPLEEMVTMDYLYRANWSLWLDLKLLLRTVPHVLRARGL